MSEISPDCRRFEDLLATGQRESSEPESAEWRAHLESCEGCRIQLAAHRLLLATYAEQSVPEPSPAFDAGLRRKLAANAALRPLRGWRLAAMVGYAALALAGLVWIFTRFPLPTVDLTSPWATTAALLLAPLSLWAAAAVTRWLPANRPRGLRMLTL